MVDIHKQRGSFFRGEEYDLMFWSDSDIEIRLGAYT